MQLLVLMASLVFAETIEFDGLCSLSCVREHNILLLYCFVFVQVTYRNFECINNIIFVPFAVHILSLIRNNIPRHALHEPVESKTRTHHGGFGSEPRTAVRRGGAGLRRTGRRWVYPARRQPSLLHSSEW